MRLKVRLSYLLVIAVWCVPFSVSGNPRAEKPAGIRAGGFLLHPGGDLSFGFDSYVKDLWKSSGVMDSVRDGYLEAGASFRTRLEDEVQHSWNNSFRYGYRQYFGAGAGDSDYAMNALIRSEGDIFKLSLLRGEVVGQYRYSDTPEDDFMNRSYTNHDVLAGASLYIQPGEGKVISQKFGYRFHMTLFSEFHSLSSMEHQISSLTRWNFLPFTSMTLLIDSRFFSYMKSVRDVVTSEVPGSEALPSYNLDSRPLRAKYGIQGLMLSSLSFGVNAGYGYSFFVKRSGFSAPNEHYFLFDAFLKYYFTEDISIKGSYRYDFHPYYGGLYRYHQADLEFSAEFWRHFLIDIELRYQYLAFKIQDEVEGSETASAKPTIFRNDHHVGLVFEAGYRIWEGFKVSASYELRSYMGRYLCGGLPDPDYNRHLALLKVIYEY